MKCAKCYGDIPEQEGVGRPRKFCGPACLKAATKEIRRLDTRIASLERSESENRIFGRYQLAAQIRIEIDDLEARMRTLLNAGEIDDANHDDNRKEHDHE